jgi:hypothetical protein
VSETTGYEPTDEQIAQAAEAREREASDRAERGDETEGPSSREVSGEDPAAEVAATHPDPEPAEEIPSSAEVSTTDDPAAEVAATHPDPSEPSEP